VPWLEQLSMRNRRPVMIAAMFVDPNDPQRVFDEFEEISAARKRGLELWGHVGCFPLGMQFTLRHPYPLEALLSWRPAIEAEGSEQYQRVLADPSFRKAVKAEALSKGVPNRFSYRSLEHMTIMEVKQAKHQRLVEGNVSELARSEGKDPFDWYLDFGLDGELDALVDCKLFNTDEDAVRNLLRHPHAAVALSDAGAHLAFLCDAGFGLHLLGHWVRDRKVMPLERAVKKLTSEPAQLFGIRGRAAITVGNWADLFLFDPRTVGRAPSQRVYDLPAGGSRIHTPGVGVHGVWVNGKRIADSKGILKDAPKAGKVLRDFAA